MRRGYKLERNGNVGHRETGCAYSCQIFSPGGKGMKAQDWATRLRPCIENAKFELASLVIIGEVYSFGHRFGVGLCHGYCWCLGTLSAF